MSDPSGAVPEVALTTLEPPYPDAAASRDEAGTVRTGRRDVSTWVAAAVIVRAVLFMVPLILPSALPAKAVPKRMESVVVADISRYQQIDQSPGRPYRDFQVEYPPVALLAIKALHGRTVGATAAAVGVVGLGLDLSIAWLLFRRWGQRAGLAYLLLGAPLAWFAYFRVDFISVALAVLGVSLLSRGREPLGGASLAIAALTKIWPIVLVPVMVVQRRWRALRWWAIVIGAGLAGWMWWGGWRAPLQVLTFRSAHGWQVESLVGSLVWTFTSAHLHQEAGAIRVGDAALWAKGLLLIAMVVLVALAWVWTARSTAGRMGGAGPEGLSAVTAVGVVLLTAPILSPQYLCWLLPWAAIAAGEKDRSVFGAALVAALLTTAMWTVPVPQLLVFKSLLLVRNAVLIGMVVLGFVRLSPKRSAWRGLVTSAGAGAAAKPMNDGSISEDRR